MIAWRRFESRGTYSSGRFSCKTRGSLFATFETQRQVVWMIGTIDGCSCAGMEGFDRISLRMGNVGWAIEGAIGSHFKVDASYLSPNVNMAARLEAATKLFNTDILISGNLRDILSSKF